MKAILVALLGLVAMYVRWQRSFRRNTPEFARLWDAYTAAQLD